MNEIEVKILEIDSSKIESKLKELKAEKIFEGDVEWTVFDNPDKRFSKKEVLIRLRKLGKKTQFTIKRLLNTEQAKVSEEIETEVSNYEAMEKALLLLGLTQKKGYPLKKHRISYTLKGVHFEIDTFPQFPTYLEIEAPSQEIIEQYVNELGFLPSDAKPWGTREVFSYYRTKSGR